MNMYKHTFKASKFDHLTPTNCIKSPQRVSTAVIVPYKDREDHLKLLLRYLHPNLQRQKISYCIFIAEQFHDGRFNKEGFHLSIVEIILRLLNVEILEF